MNKDVISHLAKLASQLSAPDAGQQLSHVDILRQLALARNSAQRDAAGQAGSMVGGGAGAIGGGGLGVAGALAALRSKLPGFRNPKMGLAGTLGRVAAGAGAGGLAGAAGGGGLGGMLGRRTVPELPQVMQQPTSTANMSQVIQQLGKTAAMEKEAFNPMSAIRAIGRGFGLAGRATSATGHGAASLGRGLMTGRGMAAGLGIAGAGAAGVQHLRNQAAETPGRSLTNPASWINPSTEGQAWEHNQGALDGLRGNIDSEMMTALGRGDMAGATALQRRIDTGNYGNSQSPWAMGGLNPFADQSHTHVHPASMGGWNPFVPGAASQYQRNMLPIQQSFNNQLRQLGGPQPGDQQMIQMIQQRLASENLLPNQANPLEQQLKVLQARASATPNSSPAYIALRDRMHGMGMRVQGSPQQAQAPRTGGLWGAQTRYLHPSHQGGMYHNPYDYRPSEYVDPNYSRQPYSSAEQNAMQQSSSGRII